MIVKIQRWIDRYVGNLLALGLAHWTPPPQPNLLPTRSKILIVKLWALGESVLVLPLIRALRQHYPQAQIDVLCRSRAAAVFTDNPDINRVYVLENRDLAFRRSYNLVFDCEPYLNLSALLAFFLGRQTVGFSHGPRARLYSYKVPYHDAQHVVRTYLDLLRPFFQPAIPKQLVELGYRKSDQLAVDRFVQSAGIKKNDVVIGICATAAESAPSRYWPKRRFAQLIDRLAESYPAKIILVGTPADRDYNRSLVNLSTHQNQIVNAAGQTSVKGLFALVKCCRIFISNDTGPMHVAAAQGVPTIGLFCPNTPVRFGPYGSKNIAIYKPVLPQPCINVHLGSVPDCRNHHHMKNITVNDVYAAAKHLLEGN